MAKKKNTKSKKKFTTAITKRFLLIADEVINDGWVETRGKFAESVGEHLPNLALMENGTRAPTLEQIALTCKTYNYNPIWLILGIGEKKLIIKDQKSLETRVSELEATVSKISRQLKNRNQSL